MLLYRAAAIDLLLGFRLHIACARRRTRPHTVQMKTHTLSANTTRTVRGHGGDNSLVMLSVCYKVITLPHGALTAETGLRMEVDATSSCEGKAKNVHNGSKSGAAHCEHASFPCCPTSVFLCRSLPYLSTHSPLFRARLCEDSDMLQRASGKWCPLTVKALCGDCLEGWSQCTLLFCAHTQSLKRSQ